MPRARRDRAGRRRCGCLLLRPAARRRRRQRRHGARVGRAAHPVRAPRAALPPVVTSGPRSRRRALRAAPRRARRVEPPRARDGAVMVRDGRGERGSYLAGHVLSRRVDQQQQKVVNGLHPGDQTPLETTIRASTRTSVRSPRGTSRSSKTSSRRRAATRTYVSPMARAVEGMDTKRQGARLVRRG